MNISIVTPALNEAGRMSARGREIATQLGPCEWIVVDGGSGDGTPAAAQAAGARTIAAPRGRGPQLNAGAEAASGEVLLFLHADTALPPGALDAIRSALLDPLLAGGNFTFGFDDDTVGARLLARVYAFKQRVFGVWYGDSAMFVRREAFDAVGGFESFPIMEDLRFVEKLRRVGRTVKLPLVARSSARRYRGHLLRTVARWSLVFTLYKFGVSPHRLAYLYPAHPGECDRPLPRHGVDG